jgi:hypothetical protein
MKNMTLALAAAAICGCGGAPSKEDAMTCGCSTECCAPAKARSATIDFLYLDLESCGRCRGADASVDAALADVRAVLASAGMTVDVRKTHIRTADDARRWRFLSSPTIRVNGRDVQLEVKENACGDCGDLCGDSVDCRVWTWKGKDHDVPPREMIVDAILREVYAPTRAPAAEKPYELPANLKKFFDGSRK